MNPQRCQGMHTHTHTHARTRAHTHTHTKAISKIQACWHWPVHNVWDVEYSNSKHGVRLQLNTLNSIMEFQPPC